MKSRVHNCGYVHKHEDHPVREVALIILMVALTVIVFTLALSRVNVDPLPARAAVFETATPTPITQNPTPTTWDGLDLPGAVVSRDWSDFKDDMEAGFPVLVDIPWFASMDNLDIYGIAHVDPSTPREGRRLFECSSLAKDMDSGEMTFQCYDYFPTIPNDDTSGSFMITEYDLGSLFQAYKGAYFVELTNY